MLELTQSCLARTPTPIPPGTPPDGTDLEVSRPEIPDFQEMNAPPALHTACRPSTNGWHSSGCSASSPRPTSASIPRSTTNSSTGSWKRSSNEPKTPPTANPLRGCAGFGWISYIGASVRNAGCRDYREGQEAIHDVVVKLLTGKLFRGFDERTSGPMDLRFKRSVGNAIRNLTEKERNRKHYIPTVPIQQTFAPGGVTDDDLPARSSHDDGEKVIRDFRQLVHRRLGALGVAVLDVRLAGEETKGLVGSPDLGSPGRWIVKRAVQQVKQLAREYAAVFGRHGAAAEGRAGDGIGGGDGRKATGDSGGSNEAGGRGVRAVSSCTPSPSQSGKTLTGGAGLENGRDFGLRDGLTGIAL